MTRRNISFISYIRSAARHWLCRLVGLFFSQSPRKKNQVRDKEKMRAKFKQLADLLSSPGTILVCGLIYFQVFFGHWLLTEAEKIIESPQVPKQQRNAKDADNAKVNCGCPCGPAINCGGNTDPDARDDANHGVTPDKQREPSVAMNLDLVLVRHLTANATDETRAGERGVSPFELRKMMSGGGVYDLGHIPRVVLWTSGSALSFFGLLLREQGEQPNRP